MIFAFAGASPLIFTNTYLKDLHKGAWRLVIIQRILSILNFFNITTLTTLDLYLNVVTRATLLLNNVQGNFGFLKVRLTRCFLFLRSALLGLWPHS